MARPYHRRAVLSAHRAYSHDPLEIIDAISGINADRSRWQLSQAAAIAAIEARTDEFFVSADNSEVKLVVFNSGEQKYLATARDPKNPGDVLKLLGG